MQYKRQIVQPMQYTDLCHAWELHQAEIHVGNITPQNLCCLGIEINNKVFHGVHIHGHTTHASQPTEVGAALTMSNLQCWGEIIIESVQNCATSPLVPVLHGHCNQEGKVLHGFHNIN